MRERGSRCLRSQNPLSVTPLSDDDEDILRDNHLTQIVARLAVLSMRISQALATASLPLAHEHCAGGFRNLLVK